MYDNASYWTISPASHDNDGSYLFFLGLNGFIGTNDVKDLNGIRPVINLSSDTTFTGSGTYTDPYVVANQ